MRFTSFSLAAAVLAAVAFFFAPGVASEISKPAYSLVQDEGGNLAQRSTLNFTGSGVSCSDLMSVTTCDISGGGGGGGAGAPNVAASFTAQTSVTITDNLGTTSKIVQCRDGSNLVLSPNTVTITNSNTTTVTFSVAQTGVCVVNGFAGSGVNVATETASFSYDSADNVVLCDASGGAVVASLPAAATAGMGRQYVLKKTDVTANACTLDADGADTIDGAGTQPITTQWQSLTIVSDGAAAWAVI